MNLKYIKTVYGNRVRINIDDLETHRKLLPLYNQYGKQLDYERNKKWGRHIHKGNLVGYAEPVDFKKISSGPVSPHKILPKKIQTTLDSKDHKLDETKERTEIRQLKLWQY